MECLSITGYTQAFFQVALTNSLLGEERHWGELQVSCKGTHHDHPIQAQIQTKASQSGMKSAFESIVAHQARTGENYECLVKECVMAIPSRAQIQTTASQSAMKSAFESIVQVSCQARTYAGFL